MFSCVCLVSGGAEGGELVGKLLRLTHIYIYIDDWDVECRGYID